MDINQLFNNIYFKLLLSYNSRLNEEKNKYLPEINPVYMNYLEVIYLLGEPTFSELAQKLGVTKPAVTVTVNNLIKLGYASKKQSDEDKRVYTIRVTDKFMQYYQIGIDYFDEIIKKVLDHLNTEEKEQLAKLLTIIDHKVL